MLKRSASFPLLLVATFLTTTFLGGCGAAPAPEPEPSASVTFGTGPMSKDPSPTPTEIRSFPPTPAGEDPEKTAIRQGWEQYKIVYGKYARDPNLTDFTEAQQVTTGFWSSGVMQSIRNLRKQNLRAEGYVVYRDVKIGDPETNSDGARISIVTACNDLSHSLAIDVTNGEKSDKGYNGTLFETTTMELGLDKKWRVADYTNEVKAC